jgi:hypothetical protein
MEASYEDLKLRIEQTIDNNKGKGFQSNNKIYRRIFNKSAKESKAIDKFGDPYFYSNKDDETISISITLPKSLVEVVNEYCMDKGVTRSRLIRKMLEYSLLELES